MAACPHCGGQITDDDERAARKVLEEKEKALQASFKLQDEEVARREKLAEEQDTGLYDVYLGIRYVIAAVVLVLVLLSYFFGTDID